MQETPGCLMLAGGRPVADVFPAQAKAHPELYMNYGPALAVGTPDAREFVEGFVQRFHNPPKADRRTLLTSGSTDGIAKCVLLLTNPGDSVLADDYTYTGLMAAAGPYGRRCVHRDHKPWNH